MDKGGDLVLWGRYRNNDVVEIGTLAMTFCPAKMFGLRLGRSAESGALYRTRWKSVVSYSPAILRLTDDGTAWTVFKERLLSDDQDVTTFCSNIAYISLEKCQLDTEELIWLINRSPKLTAVELIDSPNAVAMTPEVSKNCFDGREITAIGISNVSYKVLNPMFRQVNLTLRILRLDGAKGMAMSNFGEFRVKMHCIELLAIQNMLLDTGPFTSDFFKAFEHYFPNMKYLFIDWKFISAAILFDDQAINYADIICQVIQSLKLTFCAILFYSPDDHVKEEVAKFVDYITKKKVLRCASYSFSCLNDAEASDNFTLFVCGELTNGRTQRMVDVIVNKKVTNPNLQDLLYVLDMNKWASPDALVQFAGFNGSRVTEDFENRQPQDIIWIPDELP